MASTASPPPSSSSISEQSLALKLAETAATKFKDAFYTMFDTRRHDSIRMFSEGSVMVWEGLPLVYSGLSNFFTELPPSKHTVTTLDAHYIAGGDGKWLRDPSVGIGGLLVTVTGTVAWGLEANHQSGFHHTFVLDRPFHDKPHHYIMTATCRTRLLPDQKVGGGFKKSR